MRLAKLKNNLAFVACSILALACKVSSDDGYARAEEWRAGFTIKDVHISRVTQVEGPGGGDPRSYQHGVDIVGGAGPYTLIWSASAQRADAEEWDHDVYFAQLSNMLPVALIQAPLAQEPGSAAMAGNGNIMVTMEDAWQAENTLMQSYAVFDRNMGPVAPYQQIVMDGGHSGHVAATANRFVVFFSEGWVDRGGVDNLGSGDDVWLKTYDLTGQALVTQPVAVGPDTRDWWPLVAGADTRVMLVWQRFVDRAQYAQLLYRLYDLQEDRWITAELLLPEKITYYTYDVQFLDVLDCFLLVGTTRVGTGFAFLIDTGGRVIAHVENLPAFVREAQPAIQSVSPTLAQVVYPVGRDGLMMLNVSKDEIVNIGTVSTGYRWHTAGIDGVFTDRETVLFADLAPRGMTTIVARIIHE